MKRILFRSTCSLRSLTIRQSTKTIGFFTLFLLLSGCVAGGKAPILVDQYVLEYDSPSFKSLAPVNDVIRVGRFAVVQAINTPMMIARTKPFEHHVDYYNRWRVNPGDMVTDFLLRDFRNAGLFRAVFSYRDTEDARFHIQGGIEDFMEIEDGGVNRAALTIHISLLDGTQPEITKRVVFQKKYRYIQQMESKSAAGLAQAMSRAMEKASREVITDAYNAVRSKQ